jgi:hypothetical protein
MVNGKLEQIDKRYFDILTCDEMEFRKFTVEKLLQIEQFIMKTNTWQERFYKVAIMTMTIIAGVIGLKGGGVV